MERPPGSRGLVRTASAADRAEALRMAAPSPGSYWRLRDDFAGQHDDRCRARAMGAGTVLMLAEIKTADGEHHAYVFAPHPAWTKDRQQTQTFHADDLYRYWEPAPDGEAVRASELQALLVDMEETKAEMLAPPPSAVPAGLLAHDPSTSTGEPGQALATRDSIKAMEAYAARVQEDAQLRSNWITEKSRILSRQGSAMARFHSERATAALAKANAQLEGVKGVLQTVANLKLYTGEGVDAMLLRDGDPATPDAPITVYQELLALDEETLILLDAGGLDHTHVDELADALADPELVARMIPAERGMVLCQFRASYKEFFKGEGAAAALANDQMNRAAQLPRLLVRDGERLWLVGIDGVLDGLEQLLPSTAEQASYFTVERWGREPRRITREDISYADAQREQMGRLDRYGKVLIALWGLYDRQEIFVGSSIAPFSNWLDPGFQARHMKLVSLDSMIAVSRPDFRQWQAAHNASLASGAWVALNLREALTARYAPGAFAQSGMVYEPELPGGGWELVQRVKADATGLFVHVPMRYDGYGSGDRNRIRNIKLHLIERRPSGRENINDGFLVLDRVRGDDLDYYLGSRKQRRSYGHYVSLFRAARAWVLERDEREAPLRSSLAAAVHDAGLPHDPDALEGQLTEALAIARTARRSPTIPKQGTAAWKSYWKGALGALHAMLTSQAERVAAVEQWAAEAGRKPLRLALSGADSWVLYLVPTDDEALVSILGSPAHVAVAEVCFQVDAVDVAINGLGLLRSRRGEQVVYDWPAAADWQKKEPTHGLSFDRAKALVELTRGATAPVPGSEQDLLRLVGEASAFMRKHSKGQVRRMDLVVPVGFVLAGRDSKRSQLLLGRVDALRWAYLHGSEEVKGAAVQAVDAIYAHPERHIKSLRADEPDWSLVRLSLSEAWKYHQDFRIGMINGEYRWVEEAEIIDPTNPKKGKGTWSPPDLTVTAVTPTGVEVLPWLATLTRGALEPDRTLS